MWEDWDPKVIDRDFELLSEFGISMLRVFPLWPVFQKLEPIYGSAGKLLEIRGGIDSSAMEKFAYLVKTAEKYGIDLIVSLINGWMSGRLYVPQPFYNRNVLTDPEAIRYQVKFVKNFISAFKHKKEISAWDLGNECNVMGEVDTSSRAWLWMNTISNAIRNSDGSRPVYAGMHGLTIDGLWRISDVADCCDVLTTHPYPLFTPHCGRDILGEGRSIYHAVAESRFYSDLSGKPCIIEELGSLGPNVASDEQTAQYLKKVLELAAEEGIEKVLWWCAFDQPFYYPPYENIALERELGLFTSDCVPKPSAFVIKDFINPQAKDTKTDIVCLLTEGQDHWLTAFGSYILSYKAGMRIRFAYTGCGIPESNKYMMPCIRGFNVISKSRWETLKNKISQGAHLYISYDGGFLSEFEQATGIAIKGRKGGKAFFNKKEPVLISDYGDGKIIFCSEPIENECILNEAYPEEKHMRIYSEIAGGMNDL
jgi:endo-1,4-beta-mannosidase